MRERRQHQAAWLQVSAGDQHGPDFVQERTIHAFSHAVLWSVKCGEFVRISLCPPAI